MFVQQVHRASQHTKLEMIAFGNTTTVPSEKYVIVKQSTTRNIDMFSPPHTLLFSVDSGILVLYVLKERRVFFSFREHTHTYTTRILTNDTTTLVHRTRTCIRADKRAATRSDNWHCLATATYTWLSLKQTQCSSFTINDAKRYRAANLLI